MIDPIYEESIGNDLTFSMIYVQGGQFKMGSNRAHIKTEFIPLHDVWLSDFYIGQYVVTQEIWMAIMEENPSNVIGDRHPVEKVSWQKANDFIDQLNKKTKQNYRLPTEAEWEYAARGGIKSKGYEYARSNDVDEVAWIDRNTRRRGTSEVGQKLPNELGLYDMSGNVVEWCEDKFTKTYYQDCLLKGIVKNPVDKEGQGRILRGGCFSFDHGEARLCRRSWHWEEGSSSSIGFRLVLPLASVNE